MKIAFLGGASAIGASSTLLEVEGRRWLVDCGVRLKGSGAERLPDLSALETAGAPTAVFVTHAHLDHAGALPVLHMRYPLVPVYATAPTIELVRILLLDSLRIMAEEAAVEGELPLYSEEAVRALLERMVPVTPLRPFAPEAGGPEVTFFPAGHILGAAALGIESREGNVLVSGDVSADNQRTVPGMRAPRFRARVAVFESTYGKRLHPDRASEETRLAETVAETVAGGGKVLIPAFAIGRAQEVILVLLRAQKLGRIPAFPVYADGMVRAACGAYASFPRYLQSSLRRRVEKGGDPFFGVLENVRAVRSPDERKEILAGPPCAIVASSGMLSGGPSTAYARELASDPRNLIAVTGYQDEESPGRALLEVASGRAERLVLDGVEVAPRCKVSSYGLSAHASGIQIAGLLRALRPSDVFLVHGDAEARHGLADLLVRERIARVHLPSEGEPVSPPARREARASGEGQGLDDLRRRLKATGIAAASGGAVPPSGEDLAALARHVRETYREGCAFSAEELWCIWAGSEPSAEELEGFEDALRSSLEFSPHPARLFEFVAKPREEAREGRPPFEPATALAERIDRALPSDAGLLRKSYQPGAPHMVLHFAFPDVAGPKCRGILDDVFSGSGWTYEIRPEANLAALTGEIRRSVPDPRRIAKPPSVRLEERTATAYLSDALSAEEVPAWEEAAARIRERTGFEVRFEVVPRTPLPRAPRDASGRLEVNAAYAAIRAAFAGEAHAPYRVGKKSVPPGAEPAIELKFISPEVGARYRARLDALEREIGWRLEVASTPNMSAILEAARALLAEFRIRKGPSFSAGLRTVAVELERAPEAETWARVRAEFEDATGYRLEARGASGD